MVRKGGFIKGLGLGALVAGVGALLFAPKSGKQTRTELLSSFDDVKQRLSVGLDDLKEASVRVKQDSVKETKDLIKRAEKLKEQLNATALKLTSVSDDARVEVRGQAEQLVEDGKALLQELDTLSKKIGASTKREVTHAADRVRGTVKEGAQEAEIIGKQAQKTAQQTVRKATSTAKKTTSRVQKTVKQAATKAVKTAKTPAKSPAKSKTTRTNTRGKK